MEKIERSESSKLKTCFSYLATWGLLFLIFHLVHMHNFVVDVVFYAALKALLLSGAVTAGLYFVFFRRSFSMGLTNYILTISVGLSTGYIFAITVPTIIDRSLSAYILEKFVQRGGGIKEEALYDIFIDEFIPESQLMDIRLQEALSSGTLVLNEDGCISITKKGRQVAKFTRFYRNNLLPKKRLLLDRVTDDLTDPFRFSPETVDYLCNPSRT